MSCALNLNSIASLQPDVADILDTLCCRRDTIGHLQKLLNHERETTESSTASEASKPQKQAIDDGQHEHDSTFTFRAEAPTSRPASVHSSQGSGGMRIEVGKGLPAAVGTGVRSPTRRRWRLQHIALFEFCLCRHAAVAGQDTKWLA